jgi:hypothetical protein
MTITINYYIFSLLRMFKILIKCIFQNLLKIKYEKQRII